MGEFHPICMEGGELANDTPMSTGATRRSGAGPPAGSLTQKPSRLGAGLAPPSLYYMTEYGAGGYLGIDPAFCFFFSLTTLMRADGVSEKFMGTGYIITTRD